jgi:hypothetical protein
MRHRSALACALVLGMAAPALAQQHAAAGGATVSLSGYVLTDLDPTDGIAPSITFARTGQSGDSGIWDWSGGMPGPVLAQGQLGADGTSAAAVPGAAAQSSVAGRTATAATWADGTVRTSTYAGFTDSYTLSPHTRLTLTFAGTTEGARTEDWWSNGMIDLTVMIRHDARGYASYQSWGWNSDYPGPGPTLSLDVETGDVASDGYFAATASASVLPLVTPPVPEPGGWMMLAAGVPLLLMGRRRRPNAQPSIIEPVSR